MRKLKADKSFIPVPIEPGDEYYPNGIFVFNITKILDYIKKHKDEIPKQKIKVTAYYVPKPNLIEEHIEQADLSRPVILAEIRPGSYNLIDGHHRLEKANRMGMNELDAYFLSPEQHTMFLSTQKGYEAYIVYWNEKVEQDIKDGRNQGF